MTIRMMVASIVFVAVQSAAAQQPAAILKHEGWVAAVAFAPDGKTLASAGADNVVRLWEVGTWKPKGVLKGHTDCVTAVSFEAKSFLATGSFDGTVKRWSLLKNEAVHTYNVSRGAILTVAAGSSGGFLSGSVTGGVWMHPPSRIEWRHKSWVNSLAIDRELKGLASGSSDGTVLLRATWALGRNRMESLEGGAGEVRCVAFSPNGKLLAAGNRYHTVRIWDVETRKEIKTITGHMGDVWSIAFSPDGKTLAAVDTDWKKPSKIKLYDTTTWKERGSFDTPGEILSIAYSPKGDWLAAGCWDKTVRVFAVDR